MARTVRVNGLTQLTRPMTAGRAAGPTVVGPLAAVTSGAVTSPALPSWGSTALPGTWTSVFVDEFTGTDLDYGKWSDRDFYHAPPGFSFDAYYPLPAINKTIFVAGSVVTFQARRDATVPSSVKWRSGEINTRGKYFTPAGDVSVWMEARLWCPPGFGTSPQWWAEGDDQSSPADPNLGWSMAGEIDFMEMFNVDEGFQGIPHTSLHWPKDVYISPPRGTRLNDTHVAIPYKPNNQPLRNADGTLALVNSWHTYSCWRTKDFIRSYVDGVFYGEFRPGLSYNGSIPLPPMLFTNKMFLRLGLGVGGYQGSGKPESAWQESDYLVDYVKVWQRTA